MSPNSLSRSVRFSILMPSYNPGEYFASAVESALASMGPDDELIVQDACSTDGSAEYIDRVAALNPRVKVQHEQDQGQSDALNRALSRSQGEFIIWLNADDLLEATALLHVDECVRAANGAVDIVQGQHRVLRADGSTIASYDPEILNVQGLMKRGCYVFSGSVAFRKSVLEKVGGFATDLSYCMDLDLMFRISMVHGVRIRKISHMIGALRWHDDSKSGGQGHRFVIEGLAVRRRYSDGAVDVLRTLSAASRQFLALATTPLRHSGVYARVRGRA